MGQAIATAAQHKGIEIGGQVDQGDDLATALASSDVVLDFSFHEATAKLVDACAATGKPVIIGTTGHTEDERSRILKATETIPIVWAGNYSIGVNVLFYITEMTARKLDASFHPEVIEAHHQFKADAPSGTAQGLVEALLSGRNWKRDRVIYGREGITGERPDEQIGVHAVRGGGIIGDHTVLFAGESERLELKHQASDRQIFANGALHAASWVLAQTPGLYSMRDVLGLT